MSLTNDDVKELKQSVSEIHRTVTSIDKNVAVNTQALIHHMARTTANEVRITYLERLFMGLAATAVLGGLAALLLSK